MSPKQATQREGHQLTPPPLQSARGPPSPVPVRVISLEALRGLVLEETLARLLLDSGYSLLVEPGQDRDALKAGRHGLLVRGRGADHQADALGELLAPTPFGLPVRLFVEAKYRDRPTGLADVRNAHGVIDDVNQHYARRGRRSPLRRHDYRYSLFSTSGFTRNAQEYALAQQLSLVDLSGPAFHGLRTLVHRTAVTLHDLGTAQGPIVFPTGLVRTALRLALGTWTAADTPDELEDQHEAARLRASRAADANPSRAGESALPLDALAVAAADLSVDVGQSLLLGFPPAPFVLALRPDDMRSFDAHVERRGPVIDVDIVFARSAMVAGDWVIAPSDESRAFELRFGLPGLLEAWLLAEDGAAAARARTAKRELLGTITVFRDGRAVSLRYRPSPSSARRRGGTDTGVSQLETTALRRERERDDYGLGKDELDQLEQAALGERDEDDTNFPNVRWRAEDVPETHPWPAEAVEELLRRLDVEAPLQATLIREAAASDRTVTRARVYELGGFHQDRTLRGLTRPVRRITTDLAAAGLMPVQVLPALQTVYPHGGVRAAAFQVPVSVADAVRAR